MACRVSAELIERVRSGDWSRGSGRDREHQDTLAARGYWQAFQQVKASVGTMLAGQNAGDVAQHDHGVWYRERFGPSVAAGIVRAADLAGYRNGPVCIRHSMHVPPRAEAVRDLMPAFFNHWRQASEPAVRVVPGHLAFVYVHPYLDGNGRMGRFLMNAMLASGGYPWTVVPLAMRDRYVAALESSQRRPRHRAVCRFAGGTARTAPAPLPCRARPGSNENPPGRRGGPVHVRFLSAFAMTPAAT